MGAKVVVSSECEILDIRIKRLGEHLAEEMGFVG